MDKLAIVQAVDGLVAMSQENAEALIDKVLPRNLRNKLVTTDLQHLDFFFAPEGGTPGDPGSYEAWIGERAASQPTARRLAWLLLAKPYKRLLGGSIRQVVAFREAMSRPPRGRRVRFGSPEMPAPRRCGISRSPRHTTSMVGRAIRAAGT